MAILFTALVFKPCSDTPVQETAPVAGLFKTMTITGETGPASAHPHHSTQNCSPLCLCHCCHTHASIDVLAIEAGKNAYHNPSNPVYIEPVTQSPVNVLFRPPIV